MSWSCTSAEAGNANLHDSSRRRMRSKTSRAEPRLPHGEQLCIPFASRRPVKNGHWMHSYRARTVGNPRFYANSPESDPKSVAKAGRYCLVGQCAAQSDTLRHAASRNRAAPISGFVSVLVSIGPVIGPIQGGRFRLSLKARTADRASYQGFTRVLAGIRFNLHLNGVQGVAGSNPAGRTGVRLSAARLFRPYGAFSFPALLPDCVSIVPR